MCAGLINKPPLDILCAQLNPRIADFEFNTQKIRATLDIARERKADLVVFPELFITGYPPEDLILHDHFIDQAVEEVHRLHSLLQEDDPTVLIGAPWRNPDNVSEIYNAVVILTPQQPIDYRAKTELPNYGVFDEKRTFTAAPLQPLWSFKGYQIGLPICEDIWMPQVCAHLARHGAELFIAVNGSPYERTKHDMRRAVVTARQHETHLPFIYVNRVGGQDELVFDGDSFAQNARGNPIGQPPLFEESLINYQVSVRHDQVVVTSDVPTPQPLSHEKRDYCALVVGLRDYIHKTDFRSVLLGLSGGIDSALVAAIAVDALGAEHVTAYMLPYAYTSADSLSDAECCAANLGIAYHSIPIEPAVRGFEHMLAHHASPDGNSLVFENLQSRTRGTLLMALSNATGAMLLTTGNKSEMATGYATIYGDMNGGFNPIKDLYKSEVYALARLRNTWKPKLALGPAPQDSPIIPQSILDKAPSAELRPDQKDSDSLPDYDRLDPILIGLIEHHKSHQNLIDDGHLAEDVRRVGALLNIAEYKRRQAAPGIKVTARHFGRDWRYPISKKIDWNA